jgi:hypothetical protein
MTVPHFASTGMAEPLKSVRWVKRHQAAIFVPFVLDQKPCCRCRPEPGSGTGFA